MPNSPRLLLILLLLGAAGPARAGDPAAEAKVAMPLLLRALTYDLNFDSRGVGDFTVLVVSEAGQADKRDLLMIALREMPAQKVKARPIRFATVEFKDEPILQAEIDRVRASALLVVPGISIATLKHVWEVGQDNQAYVLALEASMVEFGLPIGVHLANGKPQILINEKGAKSVGVKFETAILKLARIIQ